ncbi:Uncharacterised protein [Chlamydia abortus]|nr:Uncharacterised protein [Chlamydia abortus]
MSESVENGSPKKKNPPLAKKEVLELKQSLLSIRKDLEKKRNELKGTVKSMQKLAVTQEIPEWVQDVRSLYSQKDYTYWKLIRTLRKHKML